MVDLFWESFLSYLPAKLSPYNKGTEKFWNKGNDLTQSTLTQLSENNSEETAY